MFKNEPLTDFSIEANRSAFSAALQKIEHKIREGTLQAAPIVAGKELSGGDSYTRLDPSATTVTVGKTIFATIEQSEKALACVAEAQPGWADAPASERAKVLRTAAALMRERRHDLSALMVREAGKPWKEADADTAEAIDFCDYYAAELERISAPLRTMEVPGEDNVYFYQPRGVCLVIAPWNFPLAIACGMSAAALVCGNAVILKPAEQTSLIAYELAKVYLEAGVPPQVFAFLPGHGEQIGAHLVDSPAVDMICFTGSKAVGLHIIERAAKTSPQQRSVKRVVAEMGGKNAIIVDEDADLDEAIKGIIYSAFGFSGQKCSACSRLIVLAPIYQQLIKRLCEAAGDVLSGEAREPSTVVGPVIDQESQQRILNTIADAEKTQRLALRGHKPDGGYFVPPAIFRDVDPNHGIWREEIFGPVLAALQVPNFDQALQVANNSRYALTGGLYSRSPRNIERAKREFKVGNLYINRGCTGALVCRHPFGGFKMSGVGSKAGGPDYLLQFMEPRTVTENTMRRGFAPE